MYQIKKIGLVRPSYETNGQQCDQWATPFRKTRVLPIGLTHCINLSLKYKTMGGFVGEWSINNEMWCAERDFERGVAVTDKLGRKF